ncbi:sigma-54-dependent Fis family transcriptional regulator [Corallococcus sp. AB038B]|uniref:sigma-54-dependent Fis family transcriptional regulator n=1 Tax=Corallococcus sp. AB038B TaxID=2316718 RepID=UPI000EF049C5|nr:sigma 54-interacting transcriptional regulator [Corallococcus sp. AB038B]RKI01608.1 sigma-54-dependent Fis family transcriptional regulator [Corallococcus sp. AB038B]
MIYVDEMLPAGELESEVVLHLRLHLRRAVRRRGETAAQDLAMLFGFPRAQGSDDDWKKASAQPEPFLQGAEVAARRRGSSQAIVALGHDEAHLKECKTWLEKRKEQDAVFSRLLATDLATLLELSKARDLAAARIGEAGHTVRYLPLLIQGDTGVGKEVLAESIHALWKQEARRPQAPFKVVQVAGLPPDLINDELFGHAEGAFTGARTSRLGRLEAAQGGTLLIDEVGDLPPDAQLRLLRFLQTHKLARLGENEEREVDVRILAATWRNLEQMVQEGTFRQDLLYRLRSGTALHLRPLARREGFFQEVVPELMRRRGSAVSPPLTRSALAALTLHPWHGNLREVVGVLDEALSLSERGRVGLEHLPAHIQRPFLAQALHQRAPSFLSDELESQELTAPHVQWRIEQVEQSLSGPLETVEQSADLGQLTGFLGSVGKDAPENQETLQSMEELAEREKQIRQAITLSQYWRHQAGVSGLPAIVQSVLHEKVAAADRALEEAKGRYLEHLARANALLSKNPWMSLVNEIRRLPLFQEVDQKSVTDFITTILKFLESIFPPLAQELRSLVRKGDVLKRIQEELSPPTEASQETEDEDSKPERKRKPSDLAREEWEALTKSHKSLSEACDATGFDPKTFKTWLGKHGIENPWQRSQSQ